MSKPITVGKLARMLGVHHATVFLWLRRKLIMPGRKIGRYRVWTAEEAEIIVQHARDALGRALQTEPVRVTERDGIGWQCPACLKVVGYGNSPAAAKYHLRCCHAIWQTTDPSRQAAADRMLVGRASAILRPPKRLLPRREVVELALQVVDGKCDPEFFAEVVKIRLNRIRELENELHRLQLRGDPDR